LLHTTLEGTVAAALAVADISELDGFETDPKIIMLEAAALARQEKN